MYEVLGELTVILITILIYCNAVVNLSTTILRSVMPNRYEARFTNINSECTVI